MFTLRSIIMGSVFCFIVSTPSFCFPGDPQPPPDIPIVLDEPGMTIPNWSPPTDSPPGPATHPDTYPPLPPVPTPPAYPPVQHGGTGPIEPPQLLDLGPSLSDGKVVGKNEDGMEVREYQQKTETGAIVTTYQIYDPTTKESYPAVRDGKTVTMSETGAEAWRKDKGYPTKQEIEYKKKEKERKKQEEEDDESDAGCTNLYVLDDKGREHFIAYTLTAIGVEKEKWESRAIPIPITGDITIRLVKEMPRETTFIDQVKLRVKEKNSATGETMEYDLEGIAALKNRSKENLRTAFRNDGNHIPIYSSREPDPKSKWGVKKGDFLEITFKVPPHRSGYERKYYVLTFGYHVKKFVDLK